MSSQILCAGAIFSQPRCHFLHSHSTRSDLTFFMDKLYSMSLCMTPWRKDSGRNFPGNKTLSLCQTRTWRIRLYAAWLAANQVKDSCWQARDVHLVTYCTDGMNSIPHLRLTCSLLCAQTQVFVLLNAQWPRVDYMVGEQRRRMNICEVETVELGKMSMVRRKQVSLVIKIFVNITRLFFF